MQKVKITKFLVSQIKPGDSKIFWDIQVTGFGLRIYASGKAAYIVKGRKAGKQFIKTIGSPFLLEPEEAREEARLILKDAKQPKPSEKKPITFSQLSEYYLNQYAKPQKRSWKSDEQRLRDHLLPVFGSLPLTGLTRQHYIAFHVEIGSTKPILANRLRELTARMYKLAQDWDLYPESKQNPASRIKDFPEVSRDRWLTAEEIQRLDHSLNQEPNPIVQAIFRLLLLTGLRKQELLKIKWSNVDLVNRLINIPQTKNGRAHWLPISIESVNILMSLPRRTDNEYCFIGQLAGKPFVQIDKAWQRIRKRAGLDDVVIHDLRRTHGAWLAQQGESLHIIGKVLNHRSTRSTEVYARLSDKTLEQAVQKSNTAITNHLTRVSFRQPL